MDEKVILQIQIPDGDGFCWEDEMTVTHDGETHRTESGKSVLLWDIDEDKLGRVICRNWEMS